jgi:hypothetical protein
MGTTYIIIIIIIIIHRRTIGLPLWGFLITHTIRHTVGLLWMSDQPVSETSNYTGQHNI